MKKLKLYQVDAFSDKLFAGNPAAVCPLEEALPDAVMQQIAAENNLAETAFILPKDGRLEIRWFTPTVEVDLCGHATLASAYVYFEELGHAGERIDFYSPRSGPLGVSKVGRHLFLDFPADTLELVESLEAIEKGISSIPLEVWKGKTDYIAVLESEAQVRAVMPNFLEIERLEARGLIITAPGEDVDFVSRFFAPQSGVNEDPVTGSAHTSLIPLWSKKLGKKEMQARQLSKRGGEIICRDAGARSIIGGAACLYLVGEINIGA